ncbi:type IV toxin-antitoxin system AbiEi family antitoxin [Mycobacterium sp. ACS4331]|uniref:type IV toxin-antitoxin system AbiEi family antitoxin n=1 Tax=Mycobacterium sp. ACS4331 TaxID=1834121 RepID=UPI0007FB7116|nr:type IV toxin-antitoxin system AbiEi family antitoxin [Mycobacterium sp. ACS4331]OBF19789.1 hypothetical protein A5727_09805 [Mycobacterium sp. ACS4331]
MHGPIIGPEEVAAGALTRGRLRWNFEPVVPRVYVPKGAALTLLARTEAVWLWTGREGVIAGRAAAALHGVRWIDADIPVEVIAPGRRRRPGVIARQERIADDEVVEIAGMRVTSPARTAFDLARHLMPDPAVAHLDALAGVTGFDNALVMAIADRYPGARWLRRARTALDLVDAGAQSPRETWLRLLVMRAGFPRPRTQIWVSDGMLNAYLDMGWDEPKIGLEYDGQYHFTDRSRYVRDLARDDMVRAQGWRNIRVVAEHSQNNILRRVRQAWSERGRAA